MLCHFHTVEDKGTGTTLQPHEPNSLAIHFKRSLRHLWTTALPSTSCGFSFRLVPLPCSVQQPPCRLVLKSTADAECKLLEQAAKANRHIQMLLHRSSAGVSAALCSGWGAPLAASAEPCAWPGPPAWPAAAPAAAAPCMMPLAACTRKPQHFHHTGLNCLAKAAAALAIRM